MFAYGKHGAKAPPAFLPAHAGRVACYLRNTCFAGRTQTPPLRQAKLPRCVAGARYARK